MVKEEVTTAVNLTIRRKAAGRRLFLPVTTDHQE
jgi:hypothetical protein